MKLQYFLKFGFGVDHSQFAISLQLCIWTGAARGDQLTVTVRRATQRILIIHFKEGFL